MNLLRGAWVVLALIVGSTPASAQGRPDPAALQAAQREAMKKLAFLDGRWRGEGWTLDMAGVKRTLTQTERVGTFLDGTVRVIEGRGYDAEGKVEFNALAVVSYHPDRKAYGMRSYAMGFSGDYAFTLTENGFDWTIQSGPMTRRYSATVKDGVWHEVGFQTFGDGKPVQVLEMTLRRIGDTDWPTAGAVPAAD